MGEPSDTKLPPGTMVGAYRIDRRIGAGGVGTVYAAEEPTIKKRVAIKVLRRSFAEDEQGTARFEREARAANEIRHPGIVDVFAFGALPDGRPYLVMSLLEGRSLREEIEARGRLPPAEAWRIAREVAEALAAAHEVGVIHRDLKPDNVFLERFGGQRAAAARARVLDFGIPKMPEAADGAQPMKLTATGVPIGTPAYMAPEQWWCAEITARTDQYAFGAMLFEMLAGRPPFASQQFVELVQMHVHEAPPRLADVGVGATPAIEAFVARALAKAEGDRFASMSALIEAGDLAFTGSATEPVVSSEEPMDTMAATVATGEHLETAIATAPTVALDAASLADVRAVTDVTRRPMIPLFARPFRRWLGMHAAIVALGVAGVIAVGYAGETRHDPRDWFLIGGWGQIPTTALLLIGAVGLVLVARRRASTGVAGHAGFWLALAPALMGAFTTYTGWHAIQSGMGSTPLVDRFTIFSSGTYEANAARFVGFSVAAILFLSLSALPAISGIVGATTTLSGALGVRRKESLAAAAGLALIAAIAAVLGAPSGALIAGTGAAVLAVGAALPTLHTETAARDELERGIAGLMAVALAAAASITRLEAREAVVWNEAPTRAARVAEILAAQAERDTTVPIAALSILVILLIEALRGVRLARFRVITRPRPRTAALITVLCLGVIGDLVQHGRFVARREELRAEIGAQFSLFARLDPPSGDALDRARFAPHRATALQIARDAVAVNARGVAKLAALESEGGAAHVASDLNHALAQASVEQQVPGEIELSVSIDREVKGRSLERLLAIARSSGVKRIEILLTRGPRPVIAPGAPPEAGVVIPGDFVALPAELADDGAALPPDAAFNTVAPGLVASALAGKGPVRIAIPTRGR